MYVYVYTNTRKWYHIKFTKCCRILNERLTIKRKLLPDFLKTTLLRITKSPQFELIKSALRTEKN